MKILYFGSLAGTSSAHFYYNSFLKLGHSALPYDPQFFSAPSLFTRFTMKLRRAPSAKKIAQESQMLVKLCRDNPFDLVFVMSENFLPAWAIEQAKEASKNPPLFLYHSHDNNFCDGILKPTDFAETMRAYDFVFTTKSQNVEKYRALGQENATFLPSAYEPSVHCPIADSQSRYRAGEFPVGFVGTYDRSRDPILEALDWNTLRVWGNGWRRSPHYAEHAQHIQAHSIYYFQYADVISHTQISLGLLREEAEDRHTQRTFEIPACQSLQMSPRHGEILRYFEEDKEIVCFDTPHELKEKVDYYLRHESEAKKIARQGFERVTRERHTYQDRVSTMLDVVSERLPQTVKISA